jgi:cytochrome c oxidase cbb3-type subunit IV
MDIILFHSIWTVLLLVLFLGIWAWAWSSRRKGDFDAAARLPLEDDDVQGCTSVAGGTTPWMEEVGPRREQRPRTPRATEDLNLSTRSVEKHNG